MSTFSRFLSTAACLITAICLLSGCRGEDAAVEKLMEEMTVREKVAQLFIVNIEQNDSEEKIARLDSLAEMGLGGIIIMKGPAKPFIERANDLQKLCKVPLLECIDGEWGASMRFDEYYPYPRQYAIGKIPDAEKYLFSMGLNVAQELRDLNIQVNFAPVADLSDGNAHTGAQRRFGLSPQRTAHLCCAYVRGMQKGGIYACGKHFPGHGNHNVDSHLDRPLLTYSRAEMDTAHLVPFKQMIEQGIAFIMIGHYCIPAVDSSMVTMSNSKICVNELLRHDLGFRGIIITDALGMGGVAKDRTSLEVNIATYKAGVDMLLMPNDPIESICAIADSVEAGVFPMEDLDRRVRKVLQYKKWAGFFKWNYSPQVRNIDAKIASARRRDSLLATKMNAIIDSLEVTDDPGFDLVLR